MADFFKGLAGGFQTGLQFSEARRRNQEYQEELAQRERLRGIFEGQPTVTPGTAATPEQIQSAGLETGRMQMQDIADFGLSAQEAARYAPQMPTAGAMTSPTTYSFGGLTQQRPFTEDELNRMKMRQAIPVLAPRNTAEAMRLQSLLRDEERRAAREPLELEQLKGSIAAGVLNRRQAELQIAAAQRAEQEKLRVDQFTARLSEARRQNPNMTPTDMYRMASDAGLNADEQFRVLQNITGIDKALFEQGERDIKRMIRGRGLDGIVEQFNKSDLIGPGRNYRIDRDPKSGEVALTLVDAASGNAIGGPQKFRNEGEAVGYLSRAATSPETVGEYVSNLEARRAQVKYYESQANRNDAIANASRSFSPEQAKELNNLSSDIDTAREAGDETKAKRLTEQFDLKYRTFAGQIGKVVQPRAGRVEKPVPELSPVDMKRLESANRIIEERAKLSNGRISDADRAAIYLSLGLNPSLVGMTGLPNVQQGGGGGGAATTPAQTPGLTRTAPPAAAPGEGLSSLMTQPSARAMSSADIAADLERRAAERGLARDELRSIYRAEVEQLGLTVDTAKGLTPQRARDLRNSPYFEFFPRDVKRALTDRAGM